MSQNFRSTTCVVAMMACVKKTLPVCPKMQDPIWMRGFLAGQATLLLMRACERCVSPAGLTFACAACWYLLHLIIFGSHGSILAHHLPNYSLIMSRVFTIRNSRCKVEQQASIATESMILTNRGLNMTLFVSSRGGTFWSWLTFHSSCWQQLATYTFQII